MAAPYRLDSYKPGKYLSSLSLSIATIALAASFHTSEESASAGMAWVDIMVL